MLNIPITAQPRRRKRAVKAFALAAIVAGAVGLPASQAAGLSQATGGSPACMINGQLIVPAVDAGHTYGWSFAANFDHPASSTTVTTCLAERTYPQEPWQTQYTVSTSQCKVMNNTASPAAQFGNGVAMFDGNAYLSCSVAVPKTIPDLFWVKARVSAAASKAYTFVSSTRVTVTAQTDGACALTMTSLYTLPNAFQFSHTGSTPCGSYVEVGSKLAVSGANIETGQHKIGSSLYGPSSGSGQLNLPQNYSFNLGAAGQPYTLDWLMIDPGPARCCSPQ